MEAEGARTEADAALYFQQKCADASLVSTRTKAEGMLLMAEAEANYVHAVLGAFNGNPEAFLDFMMLDRRVYQDLGQINAEAIKGMEPTVSFWTMGSGGQVGGWGGHEISDPDMFMTLPLLSEETQENVMPSFNPDCGGGSPSPYTVTFPP